jgi:AhpD family alkylhydroperoxidase
MTTSKATSSTTGVSARLDFHNHAPTFSKAMSHLEHAAIQELDRVGLDRPLRELVRIRASQLNGCAFCLDMHTKDARAIGETEQRIYALSAWRETPFFTAAERAALALTESVTVLPVDHVPEHVYDAAAAEFGEDEMAALLCLIITINAWNAISVSTRSPVPGSYKP